MTSITENGREGKPSGSARIETAPHFDRNWFVAQRALQVFIALVICAGLGGLFGGGWLSTVTVEIGPLAISYDRFTRKGVPFDIKIENTERGTSQTKVQLSQDLIRHAEVARTVPAASSASTSEDGATFTFSGGSPGKPITIEMKPTKPGLFRWSLTADGIGEASLFQVIYP